MTDSTHSPTMISISLNGEPAQFAAGACVADVIVHLGLEGKRIAVERNQEIVPKSQHAATLLCSGDAIEIVHAIGGG